MLQEKLHLAMDGIGGAARERRCGRIEQQQVQVVEKHELAQLDPLRRVQKQAPGKDAIISGQLLVSNEANVSLPMYSRGY